MLFNVDHFSVTRQLLISHPSASGMLSALLIHWKSVDPLRR